MDLTQELAASAIDVTLVRDCVVVGLPPQLHADSLAALSERVLGAVQASRAGSVVVDCGMLRIMDSIEFGELREVIRACGLLGASVVVAGLRPGVVAHLVNADVDIDGLDTARNLEDALDRALLRRRREASGKPVRQP